MSVGRAIERNVEDMLRLDVLDVAPAFVRVLRVFNAPVPAGCEPGRWRQRTAAEHVYTGLSHAVAYLRGKRDEDHLAHAAARLLLAMTQDRIANGNDL